MSVSKVHFFRKIDVFIGALNENVVTKKYFKGSNAYYQDLLTWCIQAKRLIPKGDSIFYVCHDWRVFLTMFLSAFVVLGTLYVIQMFDDIHPKWDWHRLTIHCFSNMCGFPYTYQPKIIASRIYYACCLYGTLIFLIDFGVHYQVFMTNGIYENQLNSVDELITNDFALVGDSLALNHLEKRNIPHKSLQKFNICENLDVCLKRLDSNQRLAVAISLEQAQSSRYASKIYCFRKSDAFLAYSLQILVRKDFPFLEELNKFINAASASGLIEKWQTDNKARCDFKYPTDRFHQMTMDNFVTFFILWISLAIVPCFVFVLENVIFYMTHKQNPTKFSHYLELWIDGDRHFLLDDIRFE